MREINCLNSASNRAVDAIFLKERVGSTLAEINLEINLAIVLIVVNCKVTRSIFSTNIYLYDLFVFGIAHSAYSAQSLTPSYL